MVTGHAFVDFNFILTYLHVITLLFPYNVESTVEIFRFARRKVKFRWEQVHRTFDRLKRFSVTTAMTFETFCFPFLWTWVVGDLCGSLAHILFSVKFAKKRKLSLHVQDAAKRYQSYWPLPHQLSRRWRQKLLSSFVCGFILHLCHSAGFWPIGLWNHLEFIVNISWNIGDSDLT